MARLQFGDHAPTRRRRTTRDQEEHENFAPGSTKQLIARLPAPSDRDERGGAYILQSDGSTGEVLVVFIPGAELDPGDTSADSVREMTGDGWNPIRPKDRDPVIVRLNRTNRARYGYGGR